MLGRFMMTCAGGHHPRLSAGGGPGASGCVLCDCQEWERQMPLGTCPRMRVRLRPRASAQCKDYRTPSRPRHLEAEVDAQLAQRKGKVVVNQTYRQWRAMLREDSVAFRFLGFKDDPEKPDDENLRLEAETVPIWWPGRPMRVAKGAR